MEYDEQTQKQLDEINKEIDELGKEEGQLQCDKMNIIAQFKFHHKKEL